MTMKLESHAPTGPIETRWERHLRDLAFVPAAQRSDFRVIVVGTGAAGASASATLAERGYQVLSLCLEDSARRATSGGTYNEHYGGGEELNVAHASQEDGDSVWRFFQATMAGGNYRARESNVYRLAQLSSRVVDQAVAQGVPFTRDPGGMLARGHDPGLGAAPPDDASPGAGRRVYCADQTGKQLSLAAWRAYARMAKAGRIQSLPRSEMLELVLVDGATRGIVIRDLVSGRIYSHAADAVVLASGGYGSLFGYTARQRRSSIGGTWCAWSKGAFFANPEAPQRVPSLYSPGGLWVDYNLMSNLPGLFVIGEANFSDHGWSQLPHNSQLQALADGYFILPITIGHYLAQQGPYGSEDSTGEFKKAESQVHGKLKRLLSVQGKQSVSSVQEKLGRILRESVGISAGKDILEQAVQQVKGLQNTFWTDISVPGDHQSLNPSLQRAIHVANLLDLADLVLVHALARYGPGPASIDAPPHVAAWEHTTHGPRLHIETLHFDHRPQRSESP